MAHTVKTQALAAYIEGRKLKFAGAPLTLERLARMLALDAAVKGPTVDQATLDRFAAQLRMSPAALFAGAAALQVPDPPPAPRPVPAPAPRPVVIPAPKPAPAPAPVPMPVAPQVTSVIPKEQLQTLVAASRKSEPVIAAPPAPEPEHEISITFDEVEATPLPIAPAPAPAAPAPAATATTAAKAAAKTKKKTKR